MTLSLRDFQLLAPLADAEVEELALRTRERPLAPGEYLFREGEEATSFAFLVEGELESAHAVGGADEVTFLRHEPGGYLGAIALLTGTPYRASTVAVAPSRVLELAAEDFHRLVLASPPILRELLRVFAPVLGNLKEVERDREKLVALGRLAAGLAHELNNPAAAAVRAAGELRELERFRAAALAELADADLSAVLALAAEAAEDVTPLARLDPLEASDRIDELAALVGDHEVAGWLVDAGLDAGWVERLRVAVGGEHLDAAARYTGANAAASGLLGELDEATRRISALVGAVKQYSYMDQAPRQEVDVREGLESTLAMLAHKLRGGGIEIVREYAAELPRIDARGAELNQVWTNLIDNAIDAVDGHGRITLRAGRRGDRLLVEVADDGPGIPEEVRERIFDPFFTTKDVGQGTGLGLDIAQRIVLRHRGELTVESQPGATCFRVVLPVG